MFIRSIRSRRILAIELPYSFLFLSTCDLCLLIQLLYFSQAKIIHR